MPFLTWWPLGTHNALYGSNFDLPVGQTDLFATFAEVLKYPLPSGDQCRYSFNSKNAHVHGNDARILGRPALTELEVKVLIVIKAVLNSQKTYQIFVG